MPITHPGDPPECLAELDIQAYEIGQAGACRGRHKVALIKRPVTFGGGLTTDYADVTDARLMDGRDFWQTQLASAKSA